MALLIAMFKVHIWLLLLLFTISCTGPWNEQSNEFTLKGKISNAELGVLYLEELISSEVIPVDSIYTDQHGNFLYSKTIEDAHFYMIRADQKNVITLLIEPGEKISIVGDAKDLVLSYEIDGSAGSELLARLFKNQKKNLLRVDSLGKVFRKHKYDENFKEIRRELNNTYTQIFEDQQQFVKTFIENNNNSLAAVIALYQQFGKRTLLNETDHFMYFEMLSNTLSEAYPANKHVIDLKRRVIEYKRSEAQRLQAEENLAPGALAPEIVLPDPKGNQIALSSLRGNVVLIDFWAAWCPPCRKSNRHLKKIYEEYHPLGFEIYAVSLDRTLEQWVLGVEEDEIDWIQVSDLRFWNSPVVSLYNVTSIPHAVLIDRGGRIIDRGINISELRAVLDVLLN